MYMYPSPTGIILVLYFVTEIIRKLLVNLYRCKNVLQDKCKLLNINSDATKYYQGEIICTDSVCPLESSSVL